MSQLSSEELLEVARLFVKDKTGKRRNVYVYPTRGDWVVRQERSGSSVAQFETKRAALENAEAMLKVKEATAVIVYGLRKKVEMIVM